MKKVTVATFHDMDHARPVVERLQQDGFHPALLDETRWQKRHFAECLASVKVQVDESERAAVERRLHLYDLYEHLLKQSVTCPACNSPEVDCPQVTRKFILPTLHSILYKFGFMEKEFYCHNCHHTWPARIKLAPPADVLDWPIRQRSFRDNHD